MAQAAVDFQKLKQEKHMQEEKEKVTTQILISQEKTMKELNQNIFSDDKAIKTYNNSKVKARNFLTNVSYNRITAADYNNNNFVIDCFTFMILYLNPFSLERKFESIIEREFINVLWAYLLPNGLYVHISSDSNMKTLNKIKVKYQESKDVMIAFLNKDTSNINILSGFLRKNAILYQYLFGNLFPKSFSRINDYGINAKTLFNKYYHSFNLQKNMLNFVKNEHEQEQEQEQEQIEFDSPINMTSLYDVDNDDNDNNDSKNNNNDDDENKENIDPNVNTKQQKDKKSKRKIKNDEQKKQKREAKKMRLIEQLNENTEKMLKIKNKK